MTTSAQGSVQVPFSDDCFRGFASHVGLKPDAPEDQLIYKVLKELLSWPLPSPWTCEKNERREVTFGLILSDGQVCTSDLHPFEIAFVEIVALLRRSKDSAVVSGHLSKDAVSNEVMAEVARLKVGQGLEGLAKALPSNVTEALESRRAQFESARVWVRTKLQMLQHLLFFVGMQPPGPMNDPAHWEALASSCTEIWVTGITSQPDIRIARAPPDLYELDSNDAGAVLSFLADDDDMSYQAESLEAAETIPPAVVGCVESIDSAERVNRDCQKVSPEDVEESIRQERQLLLRDRRKRVQEALGFEVDYPDAVRKAEGDLERAREATTLLQQQLEAEFQQERLAAAKASVERIGLATLQLQTLRERRAAEQQKLKELSKLDEAQQVAMCLQRLNGEIADMPCVDRNVGATQSANNTFDDRGAYMVHPCSGAFPAACQAAC